MPRLSLRMNTLRFAAAAGFAAFIAACGSTTPAPAGTSNGGGSNGGGTSTPGGGPTAGGLATATLQIAYNLTGNVTATGTVQQKLITGVTCSMFAQGSQGGAAPLSVGGDYSANGDTYTLNARIEHYHGAATYDNNDPQNLVDMQVTINKGVKASYSSPQSSGGQGSVPSPVHITVNSDGSGSATFQGLADNNGASGTIGGTLQWTCS